MKMKPTLLITAIIGYLCWGQLALANKIVTTSPDGRVRIELIADSNVKQDVRPQCRVSLDEKTVADISRLGLQFEDGTTIGGPCEIVSTESRAVLEEFAQTTGKRSAVRVQFQEVTVTFRETTANRRTWLLDLRAANDGVAFRLRLPKQENWNNIAIKQELTSFQVDGATQTFALPLNGFTTSYEKRYQRKAVKDIPNEWLLGLPLLLESPSGTWAAITEANISEYAGQYLAFREGQLETRLSPLPKEQSVAVRHELPHSSPWRVILIGDRVGQLLESDLVLALSEPCAIKDTSWIKTGKTTFPWWNGFHEDGLNFQSGLNTATAKYYIDFCAEAGIPYHSLDGVGNTAWYGGPIVPFKGAEPTKGVDGLDLQAVLKHAKEKGVRIRLWMNWKAAEMHMAKAFPLYREWGVEGVMLDFMDRDDQDMNRFVRAAVALAAENKLTVTLHGCPKPTGLERTYPNLLTHEGVMNLEYDKWDKIGITPDHELTVPFTRMLAGPLDFHQGSFRAVKPAAFAPRNNAPLVIGTPARTLASYVVYQNHLSMVADYPSSYRGHPALPALAAIPTTWDDTKVLDAKVGEYIVIARRSGKEWHIGSMTDDKSRTFTVPLNFLEDGKYVASAWEDSETAKFGISSREIHLNATESLTIRPSVAGGAYIRIRPQ